MITATLAEDITLSEANELMDEQRHLIKEINITITKEDIENRRVWTNQRDSKRLQ